MQDLTKVYQWVEARVTPARWEHTLAVVASALDLARVHGLRLETGRIRLAAVLHDCAKDLPLAAQLNLFGESGILLTDSDLLCPPVLHGPAGAAWVRQVWGVSDPGVLGAIAWHTTAAPRMGELEKLVFLADFVSEDRNFPGVEAFRSLAYQDLQEALVAGTEQILNHLLEDGAFVHPRILWARNEFMAHKRGIWKGRSHLYG